MVLAVDGRVKLNFACRRDLLQAAIRPTRHSARLTRSPLSLYGYWMLTPARYAGNYSGAATSPDTERQQMIGYVSGVTIDKTHRIPSLPCLEVTCSSSTDDISRIHRCLEFLLHRVPADGAGDYDDHDDDGVCQRLGLCGQGESSIHSTGLQSPSFWLM